MALGVEEAVNRGFTEIHIYGATGGRLDHFMGVLQILQKPKYIEQNIIIIVEDLQNEIKLLKQGILKFTNYKVIHMFHLFQLMK